MMRRLLRWARRAVLSLVGAVVLVLVVVIVGLRFSPVRSQLEVWVSEIATKPGVFALDLEGLGPGLPFQIVLAELRIGDSGGDWLLIEDLDLSWSPLRAMRGHIAVTNAQASVLRLTRLPEPSDEEEEDDPESRPFDWRTDMPHLAIERLHVEKLELGAAVLGRAATYHAEGRTRLGDWNDSVLELSLHRSDQPADEMSVVLATTDAPFSIDARLDVREGYGGVLLGLLNDDGVEGVEAALSLRGPLEGLAVEFKADLPGLILADLDGVFSLAPPNFGAELEGSLDAHERLSQALGREVVHPLELNVDVDFDESGKLRVDAFTAELDGTSVTVTGGASWSESERDLSASFAILANGSLLPALSGGLVEDVDAKLDANFEHGGGRGSLVAEIGGVGELELGVKSADVAGERIPFEVIGGGSVAGLFESLTGQRISDRFKIDARGSLTPNERLVLSRGFVTLGSSRLELSADCDLANAGGTAKLSLREPPGSPVARMLAPLDFDAIDVAADGHDLLGTGGFSIDAKIAALGFQDHVVDELTIDLDGTLTGADLAAMNLEVAVDAHGGRTGAEPLLGVGPEFSLRTSAALDLERGNADVTVFEFRSPGIRADATLAAENEWTQISSNLDAVFPSLAYVAPALGSDLSGSGTISIDASINTATEDFHADLDARLASLVFEDPVLADLIGPSSTVVAKVRGSGEEVVVETLRVDARGVRVIGEGSVREDYSVVDANLHALVGDAVPELAGVKLAFNGGLSLDVEAKGPVDALDVDASVDAHDLVFGATRVRGVSLRAEGFTKGSGGGARFTGSLQTPKGPIGLQGSATADSDGSWNVKKLNLDGGGAHVSVDLESKTSTGPVAGTVVATVADLAVFSEIAGRRVVGEVSLNADLSIPATGQQDVEAKLSSSGLSFVDSRGRTVGVESVAAQVSLEDVLANPRGKMDVVIAELLSAEVDVPNLSFRAESREATWDVWLDTELARPSEITIATAAAVEGLPEPTAIRVSKLDLIASGTAMHLDAPFAIVLGEAPRVDGMRLALDGGGGVLVQGRFGAEDLDATVNVESVPLSLLTLIDRKLVYEGTAGCDLRVSGSVNRPSLIADIRIDDVRSSQLAAADVPVLGATGHVELKGGILEADIDLAGLSNTVVSVDARFPVESTARARSMNIAVKADADLEEVSKLFPLGDDLVRGALNADLKLGGRVDLPTVDGVLSIHDGYFESSAAGTVLDKIELEAVGEGTRVVVAKLEATDGEKGKLEGEGFFDFSRLPGWDFEFSLLMDRATLARLDGVTASANGSVTARGSKDVGSPALIDVRGRIEARRVDIQIPNRFAADVAQLEVRELNHGVPVIDPEAEELGDGAQINLDLRVVADNRIYVRGRGLDSEWRMGLFLEGTAAEPEIQGKVSSVRGTISLLGKRFEITKGDVSFAGAADNEPDFDLRAEVDAGDITAFVYVTGTPSDISIEFSSDPASPRDEVLARVLFGEGAGDLTPLQSVQLAQSLAALSGRGGGGPGLFDALGDGLGLDRLGLDAGALSAGKYLTEDVYINVRQGLTPESSRVGVEWEVTDKITVESDVGQDAGGEIGASWHHEY
ncbi:MAG: translocation and assembly module TamB [Hyphomicrobiaceae bacterium]|jgi:translocation and assembly module TamB